MSLPQAADPYSSLENTTCLTFDLGGIRVSFAVNEPGCSLKPAPRFQNFLSAGSPDVKMEVRFRNFPAHDLGKPSFIANNWSLFLVDQKIIFHLNHTPNESSHPFHSFSLDLNEHSGELWAVEELRAAGPMSVPPQFLDEILTVSLLARGRGVMIHSCGIKTTSGQGLVFSGVSTAGKSTTARLWQRYAGAALLSDERVAVQKQSGDFWIFGTPWNSEGQPPQMPGSARLDHLFLIGHSPTNQARRLGPAEALAQLMPKLYLPFNDPKGLAFTLEFLDGLVQSVPCYELGFIPDESAVQFVKDLVGA